MSSVHATDRPTWVALAATVGPAGRSPIGPGTMGALAAIPLGIAVDLLAWPLRILLVSALIWLSLWVTRLYLAGETRHDPQEIVIDELAGCTVALAFAPLAPLWFAVAFVLFRAFDIIKPWPINLLEKHEGAFGVVADDIAAGLLSGVITLLLSSFFG